MALSTPVRSKARPLQLLLLWPFILAGAGWVIVNIVLGGHAGFYPGTLWLMFRADCAQYCRHDLEAAERLDRQALQSFHGHMAYDTLYALLARNLGNVLTKEGKCAEAERYYLRAYSVRAKLFGLENDWTLSSISDLGRLYRAEGRTLQAIHCFEDVLRTETKMHGSGNVHVANALANLGLLYNDQGDYALAATQFAQSEAIDSDALGQRDYRTRESKLLLAIMRVRMGDGISAVSVCKEALDRYRSNGRSRRHFDWVSSLDLAILCRDLGNYNDADALFARALRKVTRYSGKDGLDAMHIKQRWAEMYFMQGKLKEAKDMATEVLEARTKMIGSENAETAQTQFLLGKIYNREGQTAYAIELYKQARVSRIKELGNTAPLIVTGDVYLGQALAVQATELRSSNHEDIAQSD